MKIFLFGKFFEKTCQAVLRRKKRLEEFFEVGEELASFGEGLDELHLVVKFVVEAQLFASPFEGVAAVAGEVVDLAQEGDVVVGVEAGAFFVFVGFEGREFGLPEA